jgi:hypothetical protein
MNSVKYEEILPPMDQEEIKTKSAELALFYAAKADGKALQIFTDGSWRPVDDRNGPTLRSNLSRWRRKPDPRREWQIEHTMSRTNSQYTANQWREQGHTVIEWVEVLP